MQKVKASAKQIKRFIAELSKLAPEEFLGLAKVLCVQIFGEDKEPKPSEEILFEIVSKFSELGKSQRRQVLTLLKSANHGGGNNVSASSDSETEE